MIVRKIVFWCVLLLSAPFASATTYAESVERQSLPDMPLFAERRLAQWVGAGNGMSVEFELDDLDARYLPLDATQTYQGLPSYRVRVNGENGWWSVTFAGENWEPYSVAPYVANGYLEFNVRGGELPTALQIGISDLNFERDERQHVPNLVPLSDYVTVDQTWQAVQIPLRALISDQNDFRATQISTVQLSGVDGQPQQFWLNNIRFTSPDPEPALPVIKVNQLGYLPQHDKVAKISGFSDLLIATPRDAFQLRDVVDDSVVYEGRLEMVTELDAVISGERVLQADFSDVETVGNYYITIDGVLPSPSFEIGPMLYGDLLTDSLRYLYLQRVGIDLDRATAGDFARSAGHQQDTAATFQSQTYPAKDVSGGWYDAGDYGKYTNAGATAVTDLLWTYELFGDQLTDGQLNIPESGNGVSDILDEARWELEWMLKMQDETTGGFYHSVQDTEDAMPAEIATARTIEDVDWGVRKDPSDDRYHVIPTSTTGSAVAALAHGAYVFESVDPTFAADLLISAEKGWQYLIANPETIENIGGPYSDDDDHDDRFWAASALYRVTGDQRYHDYVRFVYDDVETLFDSETDNAYGVGTVGMLGWLAYMHSDNRDEQLNVYFEQQFGDWSTMMVTRHTDSAWNLTLLDEDFYWGSNYVMLTTPLVMAVGQSALGDIQPETYTIARDALHYLLGTNPLRFSFISGYGEDSVQNLFSIIWRNDGIDAEPPGVLAGGANEYTNPLLPSRYAGKQYVDSAGAWSMNEHTVYWNTALAFNAALVNDGQSAETTNGYPNALRVVTAASGSILTIVAGWKVLQQLADR